MKTYAIAICLVIAATLFLPFSESRNANAQEPEGSKKKAWSGQKWEYRVLRIASARPEEPGRRPTGRTGDAEAELNRLGEEGWELVTIRIDSSSNRTSPIFYFKRPKK